MNTFLLNYDPARWLPALQLAAPDLEVRLASDLGDPTQVDAMLTWKVDPALIENLPNLKLLYAVGAGVDYLLEIARRRPQLRIARIVDDAVSADVATLAVAGALQWFRDLPHYVSNEEVSRWEALPVRSTAATTVAVLGLGRIGSAAAQAFKALGFEVCGWSRSPQVQAGLECFAGAQGLRELLPRAQILVCTLPLTPDTAGLVSAELLSQLPAGAFVVNVSRGDLLDEAALLAALDGGRLAGAFLDVTVQEPLPAGHPLWRHPAVRITPHVGSRTQPGRVAPQIVENLRRLRAGEPLLNLVDPAAGY